MSEFMKHKIILLALCCVPFMAFAQSKFGYVNPQEVYAAMPEKATIEKNLQDLAASYDKELSSMRDEYNKKLKDFSDKEDSLPQSVVQVRQNEIITIEQRITSLNQTAQSDLQKKQTELVQPILDKIRKAINEVGAENGLIYIFDSTSGIFVYNSNQVVDVLPMVKKKLNIR